MKEQITQRVRTLLGEKCWVDAEALKQGFICPDIDCMECFAEHGVLALFKEYVKLPPDSAILSGVSKLKEIKDRQLKMSYYQLINGIDNGEYGYKDEAYSVWVYQLLTINGKPFLRVMQYGIN